MRKFNHILSIIKFDFKNTTRLCFFFLTSTYFFFIHLITKKTVIFIYDKLIPLAEGLNDGYLTEDDVRKINLNPFKYNVTKSGKNGFDIYGVDRKRIKRSKDKDKLEKVANALNNNIISEEKVKSTRGVDKLLKLIMEE